MGCSSSKEQTAAPKFTDRKGPDVAVEKERKRQQSLTTLNEDSADSSDANLETNEQRTTQTTEVKLGDLTVRYACYSKRGRDPDALQKPNQDSYSHHMNFNSDTDALFGVYDGHGPTGHACSQFVRTQLPQLLKSQLDDHFSLNTNIVQDCLQQAHIQCNRSLHAEKTIDDTYSGTTSCCLFLQPTRVTMANVGDSRCILGTCRQQQANNKEKQWTALPLSKDQTPRRSDEAKRCQNAGARILSFGQLSSSGQEEDDVEDPPRVWAPDGNYPGTAFTRSLGDRVAKKFGVCAAPEVLPISLTCNEKCLISGSDGIWDVLSNQQVVDICQKHYHDPYKACQEIVTKSHEEWLKNDLCESDKDPNASYDDITVIVVMLGEVAVESDEKKDENTATPTPQEQSPSTETAATNPPKKRVRQKTLRQMENGPKESAFFVGSTTAPPKDEETTKSAASES